MIILIPGSLDLVHTITYMYAYGLQTLALLDNFTGVFSAGHVKVAC